MGFFITLFGHCPCCKTSRALALDAEDRLQIEIDTNRLRETELLNAALSAAGIHASVGRHAPLATPSGDPDTVETPRGGDPNKVSEREIQQIAEQFIMDAENNGYKYSEDARLLLLDQIRGNPENFLS